MCVCIFFFLFCCEDIAAIRNINQSCSARLIEDEEVDSLLKLQFSHACFQCSARQDLVPCMTLYKSLTQAVGENSWRDGDSQCLRNHRITDMDTMALVDRNVTRKPSQFSIGHVNTEAATIGNVISNLFLIWRLQWKPLPMDMQILMRRGQIRKLICFWWNDWRVRTMTEPWLVVLKGKAFIFLLFLSFFFLFCSCK